MTDVEARAVTVPLGGRPKPTPVGPVDRGRVLLATTAMAAVTVGAMLAVRSLPGSGAAAATLAFVIGLAVIPIVASPIEWFVHRYVYHEVVIPPLGAIFTVHTAHHYAFFPTWRYVTGGPARRLSIRRRTPDAAVSPVRNAGVRLARFSWYMGIGVVVVWLPAWLLTGDVAFLVGLVVAVLQRSRTSSSSCMTRSTGRAAIGSWKPSRGSRSSIATTTSTTWRWAPTSTSCSRWPICSSARCARR